MIINDTSVYELIPASKLSVSSDKNYIAKLRKKCLVKLCTLLDIPSYVAKKEIEERLRENFVEEDLKNIVQQIIICSENCIDNCILDPFLIEATASIRERARS